MKEGAMLPSSWQAEGLTVSDVAADEAELVETLHRSCSETHAVDKSFAPVSQAEYEKLVRLSNDRSNDAKPFRLQIVRTTNEKPCGYYHAYAHHPWKGCLFVSMFLVTPEYRRQGVGSRLAEGICLRAQDAAFDQVALAVFLTNTQALRFWIGRGFDRIRAFRTLAETGDPDRLILARPLKSPESAPPKL